MQVSFMIIGAMKCGTSSLASALAGHPDICFSQPKEPNFFNHFKDWRSNLPVYEAMFRYKKAVHFGEGSTSYTKFPSMTRPDLCDDLYEYNPELKFIYLVRHPVERAVSHYMHIYQRGFTNDEFTKALRSTNILSVGQYFRQISPYVSRFGRKQVHILKFEDFIKDQDSIFKEVAEFLGVPAEPLLNRERIVKNKTLGKRVMTIRQERFFKHHIRPKKSYLPESWIVGIRNLLFKINERRTFEHKIAISEADELFILQQSAEDIAKLSEMVTFSLSDYLLPALKG